MNELPGVVLVQLSDLAEKLRELEKLLKTKAENLLDSPSIATPPHDEGHSPSPNMSLSATESAEIHTRRYVKSFLER